MFLILMVNNKKCLNTKCSYFLQSYYILLNNQNIFTKMSEL